MLCIDVHVYSTCASSSFFLRLLIVVFSSWLFVMLILMYAFIVLVLYCQVDFDVDNVHAAAVNFYGV